ncbi:MAG: hypothetical protein ACOX3B_01250 [Bacilli bacterium]|jgi:hypothetical protein|nr:MAG: hypothetical protein BWX57_00341 [Tenericutes bacterium ADurb.Bin024]HOA10885.1 hypothetical protein [Bacilli bacterium]HOE53699.1 hypothetical protein [Bacilli bacterium]HOH94552.1 hypothetical protein [Bacilli bacterium]HOM32127.1 hypothetical protein [Bacilli bacterium]
MKILISFPHKKIDVFFEGAMLEYQIKKACQRDDVTLVTKFSPDIDIANFINLNSQSSKVIRQSIAASIPTLLWMFFANNDTYARVIETRKDGELYIPLSRLELINMMDGIVVPAQEARVILRKLGVKIPIFVIYGAVDVRRIDELKTSKTDVFRRYFRINDDQKYAITVMNIKASEHIDQLNDLAAAVPNYNFYVFISGGTSFIDRLRLKAMDKLTSPNLIVTKLVPEDVYRMGVIGASYFIDLGYDKMNVMTLFEPMYLKVPLILRKNVIFKEIVDKTKAYIVNDYNGAAYLIRTEAETDKITEKAYEYTQNYNAALFTEAIYNLFYKIYTR